MKPAVFMLAFAACTTSLSAQVIKPRKIVPLQPPTFLVGPESDELGAPSMIVAGEKTVDIYDHSDRKVRRIDIATARVTQRAGGAGGGPGELARPISMWLHSNGNISVYDSDQRRITEFGAGGKRIRDMSTPSEFDGVYPFGRSFLGITGISSRVRGAVTVFDSAGRVTGTIKEPVWAGSMDPYARNAHIQGDGQNVAIAFTYTGRILIARPGAKAFQELPVVESRAALKDTLMVGGAVRKRNPRTVWTARSTSMHNGLLYVLIGGVGKNTNRYVDVYDVRSLAYKHSYLLARPAFGIAVNSAGIATHEEVDDVPVSSFYKFRPGT